MFLRNPYNNFNVRSMIPMYYGRKETKCPLDGMFTSHGKNKGRD
jgi:hypothetical protein